MCVCVCFFFASGMFRHAGAAESSRIFFFSWKHFEMKKNKKVNMLNC